MQQRTFLLLATLGMIAGASAVAACSSKATNGFTSPEDDGGAARDATEPTADVTTHPSNGDASSGGGDDGSSDAGLPDSPITQPEAGPITHCSPVQGPCDIVAQDCPSNQECVIAQAADGGITTACTNVSASQHLAKGHACCPSTSDNQCASGLECIGDQTASCDGGVLPGRCTPHCCGGDAGDDSVCGQSTPEGIAGHCDLEVSIGSTPAFTVCSYDEVCKPFHIKPCGPNQTCIIKDSSGTAGCYPTYNPDGGRASKEGEPCMAANSCADGLVCLGSSSPGTCTMLCLTPHSNPNFDAGALDGGPFYGGCSAGKTCNGTVVTDDGGAAFPPWISICR
jgi:hypothetical protein